MSAIFVKSLTDLQELPLNDKPHVAVVGRSNVGKSSLVNHLTGRKNLARVSSEPGRTKTINLFEVDRSFYLVDLPGYGFAKTTAAKRAAFTDMIRDYLRRTTRLALVLLIVDARVGATGLDRDMLVFLRSVRIPTLMVVNKTDKLSRPKVAELMRTFAVEFPYADLVGHSVDEGGDRDVVWKAIMAALKPS